MELRRVVRALLALIPTITICLIAAFAVYKLSAGGEELQEMKGIATFVIGAVAGVAASAAAFYFKPDHDENPSNGKIASGQD